MNTHSLKAQPLWRIVSIDVLLLATACLIPTLSHLLALPLYHLNPMLLVLLAGMLLVRDCRNAYLLALLLPLFSMLLVGMPTPAKALCMVAEYATVVFVSHRLLKEGYGLLGTMGVMVVAMLAGKGVYYLLKALLLSPVQLVTTPVLTQVSVVLAAALLYSALLLKRNK